MDDFYKRIKKNVENRPEPNFSEDAWTNLQARMEQTADTAVANRGVDKKWLLLLALLLLGSLLINSLFFFQGNKLENFAPQANLGSSDTIVQTKIIYQTDTVFIKQIIKEKTQRARSLYPNYSFSSQSVADLEFPTYLKQDYKLADFSDSFLQSKVWKNYISDQLVSRATSDTSRDFQKQRSNTLVANLQQNDININGLHQLNVGSDDWNRRNPIQLGEPLENITVLTKKKRMRDYYHQVRPKNLMIGMSSGSVYSAEQTFNTKAGLMIGADAEIVFSRKLRLFSEFNLVRSFYKSNKMGDAFGVPEIESPNDEYEFAEARVSLQSLQYSVGLKYLFNSKNKIQPYLALGIAGVSIRPYEIVYEFEKDVEDLDLTVKNQVDRNDFLTNQLLFKTGIEYKLKKHWRLQVNGYYRYQLKAEGFSTPDIFGVRAGFLYAF